MRIITRHYYVVLVKTNKAQRLSFIKPAKPHFTSTVKLIFRGQCLPERYRTLANCYFHEITSHLVLFFDGN